jgi:hypothetical protein
MKSTLVTFLVILLGFIGLALTFSDPSEGKAMRIILTALFFLICGVAIGFLIPTAWMISARTAWGAILVGGLITLNSLPTHENDAFSSEEPPYILAGLVILLLPVTKSLLGGYLGKQLRTMQDQASYSLVDLEIYLRMLFRA